MEVKVTAYTKKEGWPCPFIVKMATFINDEEMAKVVMAEWAKEGLHVEKRVGY